MSQLKIYTNANHEIKALYYTDDKTLTEHVINREEVFGNHSDAYILGYTYQEVKDSGGALQDVICTPYVDLHSLEIVEQGVKQASIAETIIVNHSTLEEVKAFHKKAIGLVGSALIQAGFDLGEEHYSLTDHDQININTLYAQVAFGGVDQVAWHQDGGMCTLIPAAKMTQIGNMAMAYVTYHTTRINMLGQMIAECGTKKATLAITYQTPLDATRQSAFDSIMTAMNIIGEVRTYCDATVAAAGAVTGEIYSTDGCLIQPELYDTEAFITMTGASVNTDKISNVTTFKVPALFVDRDKLDREEGKTATNLNAVFMKMTLSEGAVKEELSSDFLLQYKLEDEKDASYVQVDMANNNVVSCLISVAEVYNEITDKVNEAQKFYMIKTATTQQVTTDYEVVKAALGYVEPEVPDEEEVPVE